MRRKLNKLIRKCERNLLTKVSTMDIEPNYASELGPEFDGLHVDAELRDAILAQRERYAENLAVLKREGLLPTYRTAAVNSVAAANLEARKRAWNAPLTSVEIALIGDSCNEPDLVEEIKNQTRGANPHLPSPRVPGSVWA